MFVADVKCSQATWQTVPNSQTSSAKASISEVVVHMWYCTHVIRGRPKGSSVAFGDKMDIISQVHRHLFQNSNVPPSATMPLLLPHQLFGTACRRRCGHPHHCSCSSIVSRLSFSSAPWDLSTPHDYFQTVIWPCSFWLYDIIHSFIHSFIHYYIIILLLLLLLLLL